MNEHTRMNTRPYLNRYHQDKNKHLAIQWVKQNKKYLTLITERKQNENEG